MAGGGEWGVSEGWIGVTHCGGPAGTESESESLGG